MTTYTAERELEVAIYAARTTDKEAADHYGMVRRTVSRIRNRWQDTPEFRIARARLSARLADQYADLEQLAIERAQAALSDPKTPPRDVASLGKWISEQRALTTGDVTSRTGTVNGGMPDEQAEQVRKFFEALEGSTDEELREWAANGGLAQLASETPHRRAMADLDALKMSDG